MDCREARTNIMGAQNARMLVKNHCRTKTTMSVFFVSVHVCEKMAIVAPYRPVGVRMCTQRRNCCDCPICAINSGRRDRTESAQIQIHNTGHVSVKEQLDGLGCAQKRARSEAKNKRRTTTSTARRSSRICTIYGTHVVVFDVDRTICAEGLRAFHP